MSAAASDRLDPLGQISRAASLAALTYWALFALLAPVTVWDAHVYNLGRLPIARFGGLWQNPFWNSERQIVFPLTFDAIHQPFLALGWGYGLPSYACFVGLCAIVWHWLRRWRGIDVAWLGVLALVAMPTIAFQSVGAKNDIAVVFGIAVWGHLLLRWTEERKRRYLWISAVALGFAAGAKTSGVLLAASAGLFTLVHLWRNGRAGLRPFLAATVLSVFLLGSTETYWLSYARYGHSFGSASFRRSHQNNDGIRGTAANAIRYSVANLSSGLEPFFKDGDSAPTLERACRAALRRLGLANVGYRADFNDDRMHFSRAGWDAASDFGPIGTLALMVSAISIVYWRRRELWWRFAVCGVLAALLVCATVAWMPWNNRFLILPFVLWAVALLLAVRSPALRWAVLVLAVFSTVSYPLLSFNKRPVDLSRAITDRDSQQFSERPELLPLWQRTVSWREQHPAGRVLLLAGGDSWVLPFLDSPLVSAEPTTATRLTDRMSALAAEGRPALLVVLNLQAFRPDASTALRLLQRYPEQGSALWHTPPRGTTEVVFESGRFADGWCALETELAIHEWKRTDLILELWNPSPLLRTVELSSSSGSIHTELPPGEKRELRLRIDQRFDRVKIKTAPPFEPEGDGRKLGLRIQVLDE